MAPQSHLSDKDTGTAQDNASQIRSALSRLCQVARYYASTPPHNVKPDFKGDVAYLYSWRSEAKKLELRLSREAQSEFRKQVNRTKPLVKKLWQALSKADKCNRMKNWDTFIEHIGDVNEASDDLLDALNCP
jgi:hypothetical protein